MLVILFVFSGFYFFRLTSWIHVADDDRCSYYCEDCINFFVGSLHGSILGWRCLWIHVAGNDRCSVGAGETVLAATFGGGLGTQTDPNEAVYLALVNVSFCVQPHGEAQARVPHSIEILTPRSCGLFETGTHRIHLVDWSAFFPITAVRWFQGLYIYDKHCCDVLLACVNKWVSCSIYLLSKAGIDSTQFSLQNQFNACLICFGKSYTLASHFASINGINVHLVFPRKPSTKASPIPLSKWVKWPLVSPFQQRNLIEKMIWHH